MDERAAIPGREATGASGGSAWMRSRWRDTSTGYLVAGWLGAVVLFGAIVAPAAFAVLPSRTLAGALVGRILPALFISGMMVGALVAVSARGAAGRRRVGRLITGGLLVASCIVAHFVIGGRIEGVRASAGASLDELPTNHPLRVTFGRLHGLSVAGLGLAALAAVSSLAFLGGAPTGHRRAP